MGLVSAIYTSVNGLNVTGTGLSVIGNNIANTNTVGFKGSRTLFNDVLTSALDEVGNGVSINEIQTQFTQGPLEPTDNPLDFAIDGSGFFIVKDANNAEYYTRAGNFSLDKDYFIANPNGLKLQAYPADSSGNITQTLGDIQIQPLNAEGVPVMNAQATSTATIQLNLNASDDIPTTAWSLSPLNGPASGSYNYSNTMMVYDSSGDTHPVEIFFRKTSSTPNVGTTWDAHVVWNSMRTSNNYQEQIISNLTFDTSGALTSPTVPTSVNLTWGADDWDGDLVTPPTTPAAQAVAIDFNNSTQYASPHSTVFQSIDGYPEGGLVGFRLAQDGMLYGKYSNGQERSVARLVLAKFNAPTELNKIGKNLFAESSASGQRIEATPNTKGAGKVFANSLEASNIDMAEEFVKMITIQRAFQANSVVMSTTDEMLTKLVNI